MYIQITKENKMSYAEKINNHLENNGIVMVSAYNRSTEYSKKHAGLFTTGSDGSLYVKRGKGNICLSFGPNQLLVKIKFYRMAS